VAVSADICVYKGKIYSIALKFNIADGENLGSVVALESDCLKKSALRGQHNSVLSFVTER
jgi:hypothetical protein